MKRDYFEKKYYEFKNKYSYLLFYLYIYYFYFFTLFQNDFDTDVYKKKIIFQVTFCLNTQ